MDDDFELSEIAITRMALFSYISSNASLGSNQHLISDIENILDEVLFLKDGQLKLQSSVDEIRLTEGTSVDALFREVFKC